MENNYEVEDFFGKTEEENLKLLEECDQLNNENEKLKDRCNSYYGRIYELEEINEKLINKILEKADKPNRKARKAFIVGVMSGIGLISLLMYLPQIFSRLG